MNILKAPHLDQDVCSLSLFCQPLQLNARERQTTLRQLCVTGMLPYCDSLGVTTI